MNGEIMPFVMSKTNRSLSEWMRRETVLFNMIPFLKGREFAYFSPKHLEQTEVKSSFGYLKPMREFSRRYWRCHNIKSVQYAIFKGLQLDQIDVTMNLYYTLASYDYEQGGMRKIPANNQLRKPIVEEWSENHWEFMTGVDFCIDLDAGDHSDIYFARDDCLKIMHLFNKCDVPYEVRFSGMGFHLIVPKEYTVTFGCHLNPHKDGNIWVKFHEIAKKIHDIISELVDLSIYDSKRVIKLPYSLAFYEDDIYVCMPLLSLDEVKQFDLSKYTLKHILCRSLLHRGSKVFNISEMYNCKLLFEELEVEMEV